MEETTNKKKQMENKIEITKKEIDNERSDCIERNKITTSTFVM